MLEREIENYVVAYAQQRGVAVVKLNITGRRGWPDRLFLFDRGRLLFVEFKRPVGKYSALQKHVRALLTRLGYRVEWCANKDYGRRLVDEYLNN